MKQLTLCLPIRGDRILLGQKKRGLGTGFWNGFGGKVHSDEVILAAARRELIEEVGITDGTMTPAGLLTFTFADTGASWQVSVFRLTDFHDNPQESEEMRPAWYNLDAIPFATMWPDDELWFPYFLRNELFVGSFTLSHPGGSADRCKIISYTLTEVTELPTVTLEH